MPSPLSNASIASGAPGEAIAVHGVADRQDRLGNDTGLRGLSARAAGAVRHEHRCRDRDGSQGVDQNCDARHHTATVATRRDGAFTLVCIRGNAQQTLHRCHSVVMES